MPKISVRHLRLDPENPRLPESLQGSGQSDLFRYLYETAVLDELVESFAENGFFEHEPLIVLPADSHGHHIVVEGNRRLASLMLLHGLPPSEGYYTGLETEDVDLRRIDQIPCHEVGSRDEVRKFLGYRHISGLKPWRPEAKARYLTASVDAAHGSGAENPFLHVARIVGSNTLGVRNAYSAFAILRRGKEECSLPVGYLPEERFGVWLRCMNSAEIRNYIGFGSPKTYQEVLEALQDLDCAHLGEVLSDLTPSAPDKKAVVSDSRQVTEYGIILQDKAAREVLRKYSSLDLARQVIQESSLRDRVLNIKRTLEALTEEIQQNLNESDSALLAAVGDLSRSARVLEGIVRALVATE